MSDQAQGLRALADSARRDQSNLALPIECTLVAPLASAAERDTGDISLLPAEVAESGLAVTEARQPKTTRWPAPPPVALERARVIAITSGKGGVGKTSFSTNLALSLSSLGKRVIVLDADLGLANVHVLLGIAPQYHLEHVMRGERTLSDILYPGPGNIQIIGGGSGIVELANLDEQTRRAFVQGMSELDSLADVILIDTGAGLARNVMAFVNAVEEIIVVTTPEPTAMTDAYATIKVVSQENPAARLMLVVNQAQSETEAQAVAERLNAIARQFLQRELHYLGLIPQDPTVPRAVRARKPFMLNCPDSPAARAIGRITTELGYWLPRPEEPGGVKRVLSRLQRFLGFRSGGGT